MSGLEEGSDVALEIRVVLFPGPLGVPILLAWVQSHRFRSAGLGRRRPEVLSYAPPTSQWIPPLASRSSPSAFSCPGTATKPPLRSPLAKQRRRTSSPPRDRPAWRERVQLHVDICARLLPRHDRKDRPHVSQWKSERELTTGVQPAARNPRGRSWRCASGTLPQLLPPSLPVSPASSLRRLRRPLFAARSSTSTLRTPSFNPFAKLAAPSIRAGLSMVNSS